MNNSLVVLKICPNAYDFVNTKSPEIGWAAAHNAVFKRRISPPPSLKLRRTWRPSPLASRSLTAYVKTSAYTWRRMGLMNPEVCRANVG